MVIFIFLTFLHSYEGERTQCRDNRLLGEFELNGIPPMLRGQAELVTTFEVDANGLLKVSAQDRASGRKASISKLPNLYDSGL
jgi:heat shock protein 1/8